MNLNILGTQATLVHESVASGSFVEKNDISLPRNEVIYGGWPGVQASVDKSRGMGVAVLDSTGVIVAEKSLGWGSSGYLVLGIVTPEMLANPAFRGHPSQWFDFTSIIPDLNQPFFFTTGPRPQDGPNVDALHNMCYFPNQFLYLPAGGLYETGKIVISARGKMENVEMKVNTAAGVSVRTLSNGSGEATLTVPFSDNIA